MFSGNSRDLFQQTLQSLDYTRNNEVTRVGTLKIALIIASNPVRLAIVPSGGIFNLKFYQRRFCITGISSYLNVCRTLHSEKPQKENPII